MDQKILKQLIANKLGCQPETDSIAEAVNRLHPGLGWSRERLRDHSVTYAGLADILGIDTVSEGANLVANIAAKKMEGRREFERRRNALTEVIRQHFDLSLPGKISNEAVEEVRAYCPGHIIAAPGYDGFILVSKTYIRKVARRLRKAAEGRKGVFSDKP